MSKWVTPYASYLYQQSCGKFIINIGVPLIFNLLIEEILGSYIKVKQVIAKGGLCFPFALVL